MIEAKGDIYYKYVFSGLANGYIWHMLFHFKGDGQERDISLTLRCIVIRHGPGWQLGLSPDRAETIWSAAWGSPYGPSVPGPEAYGCEVGRKSGGDVDLHGVESWVKAVISTRDDYFAGEIKFVMQQVCGYFQANIG